MVRDALDPKELILESYRIEGISAPECRSVCLDWALSVPLGSDTRAQVLALLERYREQPADHPMTQTLRAALDSAGPPKRRGGRSGRVS
jgi:hypothetical protein